MKSNPFYKQIKEFCSHIRSHIELEKRASVSNERDVMVGLELLKRKIKS